MDLDTLFWQQMMNLIETNAITLDRPKGKPHPRYPELIYPLDYGYLEGTSAGDGDGIDVWFGSTDSKTLTGILCTSDTIQREMEITLLIACSADDLQLIFHRLHTLGLASDLERAFLFRCRADVTLQRDDRVGGVDVDFQSADRRVGEHRHDAQRAAAQARWRSAM